MVEVDVRPGYRSLPLQSLAPTVVSDGYAAPVQNEPSTMQAMGDRRPYLSILYRRLSERDLADDSRKEVSVSERLLRSLIRSVSSGVEDGMQECSNWKCEWRYKYLWFGLELGE